MREQKGRKFPDESPLDGQLSVLQRSDQLITEQPIRIASEITAIWHWDLLLMAGCFCQKLTTKRLEGLTRDWIGPFSFNRTTERGEFCGSRNPRGIYWSRKYSV